jgi:predicted PurR-regulated permease PerM
VIQKELKLPFYAKTTLYLLGLFALVAVLYLAQGIIIPLIFAVIIATVLHPAVNFFVRLRINRVVAIIITLTLAILIFAILGALLFSQAMRFNESWPKLIDKFVEIFNQSSAWASTYFDISPEKIDAWISKTETDFIDTRSAKIGETIASVGSVVMLVFLIPVYIFMILYYQPLLMEFFRRLFGKSNRTEVSEVITQIKSLIQSYLLGLLFEALIIATLYFVGLMILGIEYAIILAIIGALLNLIPYIGAIIAASLPMMIAVVTKNTPWFAILVLAMYIVIQFIDNNYIVPRFVASKVKLNALITIIMVVVFGTLWGIPGMFLSIPLTAVVKLIFDHIEALKPWGYLLGDTMPSKKDNAKETIT